MADHFTHICYCSSALETAAHHYVKVMNLVEHYRAEMRLRYLPIRYEDIIDDQEGTVRRMLDFIGAEFDEQCLRFQENRRYARTASYAQVAEPRDRHVHYLQHLRSVIPILTPLIERLGYEVAASALWASVDIRPDVSRSQVSTRSDQVAGIFTRRGEHRHIKQES